MSGKVVADSRWQLQRGDFEFVQAGGMRPRREQRSDKRIVSVFRLAKLIGEQEELCLIRNISAGGLKAEVFSPKAEGDMLGVDFGDGLPQPAQVRWVEDECIGLAFDEKINISHTLTQVPAPGDRRARRLRLLLEVKAFVFLARQRRECQLIDMSQGGAKIRSNLRLEIADRVRLEIDGLGILSGVVRWVRDGHAGIAFVTPLPYRELARWVGSATAGSVLGGRVQ
jgi:hypothetical protein